MPFVVGETLGPYRITEQLGQGGMATVFKAYHAALDRYVAIKALHPALKEDVNFLARFQREARVVAKLDHPNIVPIYDFAEHEGRPYLVMKYIEGETLKARLKQRQLSFVEIIRIVEAVGTALTYAHQQGILHRDVKPSNVLLASDGQIYLADFGLARIAAVGESTLSSDMMLGTPQYISPEQAMGKRDLDEGTDIYSFGVLLYELLVGKVPFSADTPYAIIYGHIYSPLPMPRALNPKISEELERVLLKTLAKERADRYPTVAALVEAFKNACSGHEESALVVESGETQIAAIPAVLTETKIPPASQPVLTGQEPASMEPGPDVQDFHKEIESIASEPTPGEEPIRVAVEPTPIEPAPEEGSVRVAVDTTAREGTPEVEPVGGSVEPSLKGPIPAKKPLHKRWYVWLLLATGVLLICLCVWFGLARLKKIRESREQALPTLTPAPQEVIQPSDALKKARQRVAENPDDPAVHLDLALLLIDTRQYGEVPQEFARVESLMGDYGFYVEHGQIYHEQQRWIACTWAFLHAYELKPDTKGGELFGLWHEAVYKAFNNPETKQVIDIDRIQVVDSPIAGVARAEVELVAGNVVRAEAIIADVLIQNPDFAEALLVQARVFAKQKNADRIGKILDGLKRIPDLPPWIRDEIGRIESIEIP